PQRRGHTRAESECRQGFAAHGRHRRDRRLDSWHRLGGEDQNRESDVARGLQWCPMDKIAVSRVNYFSRQILRTQDFEDEQAYHLEARRRHNIGQHLWGIVSGLELTADKDGTVYVTPGFAIDGFGRELVLPAGKPIPPSAFDDKLASSLDIWAVYSRT